MEKSEQYSRFLERKDSESIYASIRELLSSAEPEDSALKSAISALNEIAQWTWWRCDCGPISPATGEMDAICPKCGALRKLPPRQLHSPWPLYVEVLSRLRPSTWFSELSLWMSNQDLGEEGPEPQGPKRREIASDAYSSENSVAGGSGVLTTEIAARGATSPAIHKAILCIDGMVISETGKVRGCQWIALPMMI